MGADTFWVREKATSAKEAFKQAVDDARYENGHGGYTGTIAEKSSFVMIPVPAGTSPLEHARKLLDEDDGRISDKWGPAGCVAVGEGEYLFFGWASS